MFHDQIRSELIVRKWVPRAWESTCRAIGLDDGEEAPGPAVATRRVPGMRSLPRQDIARVCYGRWSCSEAVCGHLSLSFSLFLSLSFSFAGWKRVLRSATRVGVCAWQTRSDPMEEPRPLAVLLALLLTALARGKSLEREDFLFLFPPRRRPPLPSTTVVANLEPEIQTMRDRFASTDQPLAGKRVCSSSEYRSRYSGLDTRVPRRRFPREYSRVSLDPRREDAIDLSTGARRDADDSRRRNVVAVIA